MASCGKLLSGNSIRIGINYRASTCLNNSMSKKYLVLINALERGWTRIVQRAFLKRYQVTLNINSLYLVDPELYEREDGRTLTAEQRAFIDGYTKGFFAASNKAAMVLEKEMASGRSRKRTVKAKG